MKIPLLLSLMTVTALAQEPPNILFIAVDDLRPELRCYGAEHMVTPNIDRLASQGRLFRNHYVSVPVCAASRYALVTGRRPRAGTDGSDNNLVFEQRMPRTFPTAPESWFDLLRRAGWHTASIGKVTHEPDGYRWSSALSDDNDRNRALRGDMEFSWDEIIYDHDRWGARFNPLFSYAGGYGRVSGVAPVVEIGVDENGDSLPDDAYPDAHVADFAIEKLREYKDDERRFCLAVGFFKPHLPFVAPKSYFDLYDPDLIPGPEPTDAPLGANRGTVTDSLEITGYVGGTENRDASRRAYFACVSYIDVQIGRVIDELDALGLGDNTVVILWGDHGWCLDDYGVIGKQKVLERSLESPLIIRPPAHLRSKLYDGVQAEGVVSTLDIYPTITELCGLETPSSAVGVSLVPMIRNPYAPGKNLAFSRFRDLTSVRTTDWRLIRLNSRSDLYDLSSYRYEVVDVSNEPQNAAILGELEDNLNVRSTRPGTTYEEWADGRPSLANPNDDADLDGIPNVIEYGAGSDPLSADSFPISEVTVEDLSEQGLSTREVVYRFVLNTTTDDLTLMPNSSTDLQLWTPSTMELLDATPLANGLFELRVRSTGERRFFRVEAPNESP